MKIYLVLLIILFSVVNVFAFDGDISIGAYINSTLRSKPGREYTIPNNYAEYIASVEVGHKMFSDIIRPYIKLETLMDEYGGDAFHPTSIKYELGIRAEVWKGLYVDLSHLCWHPIDSAGTVEQYNLVKVGVKF